MSEPAIFVQIAPAFWADRMADIAGQAEQAAVRFRKAMVGDRRESARYASLCRALERLALEHLQGGASSIHLSAQQVAALDTSSPTRHPWSLSSETLHGLVPGQRGLPRSAGRLFELRMPFEDLPKFPQGPTARIEVAQVWRAPRQVRGAQADAARWKQNLEAVVRGTETALVPSQVHNRALTDGLREFVAVDGQAERVNARVLYRDGSEARPFPLRAISMGGRPDESGPLLRVALMSMRHPEMDHVVDAAWFRNVHLSQARTSAETDELAYEISSRQLRSLVMRGRVRLDVYQTGFEPAILGFYRAVADQLIREPGTVRVTPHYWRSWSRGRPWDAVRHG